ncbi:adhesion G-protein coupled receptor G7-like [Paramisgurnus dabryanus]|uniref:adhesion G-protein coupled receptor G7-like n=1 Tax=Paramisgurnus dabryanus TaxID=90735 RepID=UPI0031F3DC42
MLLSSENISTDIAVSTVATVSQLLSARPEKFPDVNPDALSKLTQTLQNFSLREESNNLVQPNLAVQSFKGGQEIHQVQLTLFKATGNDTFIPGNDTFIPGRIKLDSNMMPFPKEKVDLQMNITFSEGMNKSVGFVLYDSDRFFPSQNFTPSLNTKRRVFSANLFENGFDTIEVQFSVTPSNDPTMSLDDFACVFWSYSENDWSTKGCIKESFSGHAQCTCIPDRPENYSNNFNNFNNFNNLNMNFAVLMSFKINYQYSEDLNLISIAGCSLSILGLAVTAVYQIATRKSRGCSPTLLLVNICLSMMIFYLLFIFGINNPVKHAKVAKDSKENFVLVSDYHQYSDEGPCTAFTALIHYFLLATFTWNTLYGINVFLLFKTTTGTPPWFPKVSLAVGWGFPAIIVGISLGSTYTVEDPLGYRQEECCWLASLDPKQSFNMRKPMFWGFLLPLFIMLIFNMAIFLHFSQNICKTVPNLVRLQQTPLKKKFLSSFSMAVMLGLSWVTGYILLFTQDPILQFILSIVFCVCNTTQV